MNTLSIALLFGIAGAWLLALGGAAYLADTRIGRRIASALGLDDSLDQ